MILPPLILLRNVLAATAAGTFAATSLFCIMDCNPAVYWYDKLLQHRRVPSYFQNKSVWIVGASSGIGEELAYQLANAGCSTLVLSSRSYDRLQRVATTCQERNPNCQCHVLELDVSNPTSLQQAVQQLPTQLDVVFFNAGRGHLSPALETSPETCQQVMQLNAIWPMILTPLLFKHNAFTNNTYPHLVITSSIAGRLGVPLSAAYAAAKHAIQGYFASLQAERPDWRIDIMCPGPVDTNFHQQQQNVADNPTKSSSKLKMPVDRCARIMLSATSMKRNHEVWIAQQPTLFVLYLNQFVPGLVNWLLRQIGPRRVELWQQGLDLYDPASWKKQGTKQSTSSKKASSTQQ